MGSPVRVPPADGPRFMPGLILTNSGSHSGIGMVGEEANSRCSLA
jgi:hypothetical protein